MESVERSFADLEDESKKHKTRRERFLERMEVLIRWERLLEEIRPYYPKAGRGRAPYELESMLRVHCVQIFYNLSDPAMEDMLYEIESVRRFTGISLKQGTGGDENQWHFGMKLHVGVDDQSGLVHSLATTSAKVHDLTASEELLHGEEARVWGDAGYRGMEKREAHKDRQVAWHIAMGRSQRRRLARDELEWLMEECKSSVRAKVEHIFFYVKQMFGYGKVRYRSLGKNENRLALLLGFANLLRAESCMV